MDQVPPETANVSTELIDFFNMEWKNIIKAWKGLNNADPVEVVLSSEMGSPEDILEEVEAQKALGAEAIKAFPAHLESPSLPPDMAKMAVVFLEALVNSSLSISVQQDDTITPSMSLVITSEDIYPDLEQLFAHTITDFNRLHASLVFVSIFIPAMLVKFYRIFSSEELLQLVSAPSINLTWTGRISGVIKTAQFTVLVGELQYLHWKGSHLPWGSRQWICQLVKPVGCYQTKTFLLQAKTQKIQFHRRSLTLHLNDKKYNGNMLSGEDVAKLLSVFKLSFCYYATSVLLTRKKPKAFYRRVLRGLEHGQTRGSKRAADLQEYWYFKKQ